MTAYNSKSTNDKLWDTCPEMKRKDPDLYRRGANGDVMYKHSYGKSSDMGFQVDHIKPKSHGGSDCVRN